MYLPGLKTKTVEYAKNFSFPKEKLLETFCRMFRRAGATPGLLKGSSPQLRGLSADNLCNSERLQQVHEGELTGHCGIPAASPSRPQRDGLRQHNRESLTPLEGGRNFHLEHQEIHSTSPLSPEAVKRCEDCQRSGRQRQTLKNETSLSVLGSSPYNPTSTM